MEMYNFDAYAVANTVAHIRFIFFIFIKLENNFVASLPGVKNLCMILCPVSATFEI